VTYLKVVLGEKTGECSFWKRTAKNSTISYVARIPCCCWGEFAWMV